jgi:hypothetical protein
MGWNEVVSLASTVAAVVATFCALYAYRVARKSLDLSRKSAQAAFEDGVVECQRSPCC